MADPLIRLADAFERAAVRATLEAQGFRCVIEHGVDAASGPDFVRFLSADGILVLEVQAAKTDLQRAVIQRAKTVAGALRVATPEDLIVLKLIASRDKDATDLRGLIRLPDLDWRYIEERSAEWELSDRLAALRAVV